MRFIYTLIMALWSFAATAQTKVDIVTRLGPTTAQYQFLAQFVEELNKSQTSYEYRIAVVPGAEGETAFYRFLSINEEEKRDAVLYTSQVTIADPRHNRIADFNYVTTLSISVAAIMANKETAVSIDELVAKIRSKEITYYASTVSSNTGKMLNQIFLKKYGLENKVKQINYANPQDILRAVLNKEADYTIFNPDTMHAHLNVLALANSYRAKGYPDVKIGKELNFNEFNYNAFSLFAIPKTNKKLYDNIHESFTKACMSASVQQIIELRKYIGICMNHDQIVKELIKERDMLIKAELKDK